MKKLLLASAVILSTCGFSQFSRVIDAGNTQYNVDWDGQLGPIANSNIVSSFQQALWLSGFDSGLNLYVSSQTFLQERVNYGPGPISNDPNSTDFYSKIWIIKKSTIDSVKQGLFTVIPDDILTWPANGRPNYGEPIYLAPFIDVDSNGAYNPYDGDYPLIYGDICAFTLFNDVIQRDTGSAPGFEFDAMAWHYAFLDGGINDRTVYSRYVLTNRSNRSYFNVTMGIFNDTECGYSLDDLAGTSVYQHAVYAYNSTKIDVGPNALNGAPYAGTVILEGPAADPFDGQDNNWDGCVDGIVDSQGNCISEDPTAGIVEPLTLTGSMAYSNGGTPFTGNPLIEMDYHFYLLSLWLDGNSLIIEDPSGFLNPLNGDGYTSDGLGSFSNFIFPGNTYSPYANWNPSFNVDWFDSPTNADDKRIVASMGMFTWNAGERISLTNASFYGLVDSSNFATIIDSIEADIDSITSYVARNPLSVEESPQPMYELELRQGSESIFIDNSSGMPLTIELVDIHGRTLKALELRENSTVEFNINNLPTGLYIARSSDGYWSQKWIKP